MSTLYYESELYHYGVPGMRWGVHRAQSKISANEKLRKKALQYDKKAANLTKKSEKLHASKDLENHNRKAIKAAKYDKKAAVYEKKALKSDDESDRANNHYKAENMKYKAAKARIDAERISKTTGYGLEAMKYSVKSDKIAKKAAKARKEIANNEAYIAMMNRKISTLSDDDIAGAYAFVKALQDG